MRAAAAMLPFLWLTTACEPAGSTARPPSPFTPPRNVSELRGLVGSLAPIEIPSPASNILAARVPRSYERHTNLFSYFFAFSCSPTQAVRIIRTDSPGDNSITVDSLRITATNDLSTGTDRPIIVPRFFQSPPVFPDVFYEGYDLTNCHQLSIRVSDAPEWFSPHMMKNGIADRGVWKRWQILVEFYYDADRQTMFLRFDELLPPKPQ